MATPATIAFSNGYLKDEWAQLVEPVQKQADGGRSFLWTGRQAEVGQRTETQVIAGGGWCRLSGVVTEVGAMPSLGEWREGDSCQLPPGVKDNSLSIDRQLALRDEFIEHFGTLHGQVVVSYSLLNFDFYDRQDQLPFKRARIYRVEHVADENMTFFWCVRNIEDVTDAVPEELPEVFRKWQEGSRVPRAVSF
ncbi:hypothetical protein ACHAXT_012371 [Thalassiosira profunda]